MNKEKSSKDIKWSNNKENNEIMSKFYEDFFEKDDIGKPKDVENFRQSYGVSMVEKYGCEHKYMNILLCLNENDYFSIKRCDPLIEDLGRCIFENSKVEKFKKANKIN